MYVGGKISFTPKIPIRTYFFQFESMSYFTKKENNFEMGRLSRSSANMVFPTYSRVQTNFNCNSFTMHNSSHY